MKRRLKLAMLWVCRALGLFRISLRVTQGSFRLLCYHGTWRTDDGFGGDSMFIQPTTFVRRLDALSRLGFTVVSLDDAVRSLASGASAARPTAVITIDDGWFGTYADMLPALEARRLPATLYLDTAHLESGALVPHVFANYLRLVVVREESIEANRAFAVATDLSRPTAERLTALHQYARAAHVDLSPYLTRRSFEYMTPDELRDASRRGLDIQLHTHNHSLHEFRAEQVSREVALNRKAIGDLLGGAHAQLEHFCYPSGLTHPDAGVHLHSCGVLSATTTMAGLASVESDLFALPRYLDGDNVSELEFEARMSGFVYVARSVSHGFFASLRGQIVRR